MPPAALAAVTIGAGALSAGGQVMQGISQQRAANAQAAAYQQQAGLAREAAGVQIGAQDYEANAQMAAARTSAAAGGENPGSGSAKVVNMMNVSEAMLRDTATRYSGNLKASSDLADAANARLQGRQALTGAVIGAGGTLLTSALKVGAPTGAGGLGFNPF